MTAQNQKNMLFQRILFSKHLEDGEKIYFVVHKHWIEILKPTLEIGFFGLLLPWGLYIMGFNTPVFLWAAVAWTIMAYFRYLYVLLDWYADAWLITSMNLIAVDWQGFFYNTSSRIDYEDIEGIQYVIQGFWATVLGYGNVTLRTLSNNNLLLTNTANPKRVELRVIDFQNKVLDEKNLRTSDGIKDILTSMVAHHMRKKLK